MLGSQTVNVSGIIFPAQHLFTFLMITTPWFPSGNSCSLTLCLYGLGRADCGSGRGLGQSANYMPGLMIIQMGTSYPIKPMRDSSEFCGSFCFSAVMPAEKSKAKTGTQSKP